MASSDAGSLDFGKAMSDFRFMFPDMEADVIEAVLRAHGGEVDATIDHLLAMSNTQTPPMEDLIQLGPSLNLGEAILDPLKVEEETPPKIGAGLAYSHPDHQPEEMTKPSSGSSGGVVPTPQMLQNRYEENLRNRERVRTSGEPSLNQYLEDERVALMLQNEEFMAELRRDQEFITTLESDTPPASKTNSSMDEAIFREKLKNMGKTSKKKFSQLASIFSRRKTMARNMLVNTSAPSNDNLLLDSESLKEEDDSEEDESHRQKASSSMFRSKGKYSSFS